MLMAPINKGSLGTCDAQSWGKEMGELESYHTPRTPTRPPMTTEDHNKGKCMLAGMLAEHFFRRDTAHVIGPQNDCS